MTQRKLIVGNWKMNGLQADGLQRTTDMLSRPASKSDIVLCPPFTLLGLLSNSLKQTAIKLGAQDCHTEPSGAFTGNISGAMLKDIGCSYVILGHSERRQYHLETDTLVRSKAQAAITAGLIPIICVGETDTERSAGQQNDVVSTQIKGSLPDNAHKDNCVIAYEPVWAIGTGKTASTADIAAMHAHIRTLVPAGMKILYGGSVKAANAKEILSTPNVDGALVGGASLKIDEFSAIAEAV